MALTPFTTSVLDDFFSPFGLLTGMRPGGSQLAAGDRPRDQQPILRGIPLDIIGALLAGPVTLPLCCLTC